MFLKIWIKSHYVAEQNHSLFHLMKWQRHYVCQTVHNHRCNQLHFLLSSFWFYSDLGFRGPNYHACISAHFFLQNYACTLNLSCLFIKLLLRECITGFNSNRVNAQSFRLCCPYGMKVIMLIGYKLQHSARLQRMAVADS